jgi:putative hemolysin
MHSPLQRLLINTIELTAGRAFIENEYDRLLGACPSGDAFWEAALSATRIDLKLDAARFAAIPKTGPLILLANHPFGVVDGLVMCVLAMRARGDFRILINSALCREPRVMRYMLPIDFSDSKEAVRGNIQSKRDAELALSKDIPIVIFPAGGISTCGGAIEAGLRNLSKPVTDLDWKLFTAKLIQTAHATAVPVYFHGRNSTLFQAASQISLTLRLALIIFECRRMLGKPLRIEIGAPITYESVAHIESRQALTEHLRQTVYALGSGA